MKDNSNITQELLETIERFYNNSMSDDEHKKFEKKLQNDTEFRAQAEDIKTLLLGIETQSFKEKLNEFHKDIPQETTKNKSSKVLFLKFTKMAVAAAVIVSIGIYWFYNNSSHNQLYAKYFTPDPGLPTTMSNTDDFDFYDAMVNYKYGDYKTAILKWEKLQSKKPDNDTINYFLGVANLANNNVENAIPILKKTVNKTNSTFNNDANFYLGLAYLKTNNTKQAIKYLKLNNSEKSKELLQKLE